MAPPEIDIAELSENQQLALQQFTSVTDQELEAAVPLLQRSEWNVQIAIAKFFDGETADPVAEALQQQENTPPPPRQVRRTESILESLSSRRDVQPPGLDPAPRIVPQSDSLAGRRMPFIFTIILTPIRIVYYLVSKILSTFTRLFPFLPRILQQDPSGPGISRSLRNTTGRRSLNPRDAAARFNREFEEEYGSHALHFYENGYAQALDVAKRDLKFLLVLLFSPEHDDTQGFVRDTLLSGEVVEYLNDPQNNIMIWTGNVRDSEAYQVANALNCTKFPFTGLISLTPQVSTTSMSVLTRVVGPTPASAYIAKLQTAISQHSEALDTVRSTRDAQRAERSLREEQNSAYERSLEIDRRRAEQRQAAEVAKEKQEREAREKSQAETKKANDIKQWKQWRARKLHPEPSSEDKDVSKISLRMRSGERVLRTFAATDSIEELYAFVECHDELQAVGSSEKGVEAPLGFEHTYGFRLVSPMPRTVYELEAGGTVRERVGRSANLIVESIADDDEEE